MSTYDDIPETALRWHQQGKGAVLATVTRTWGSAPRPVGSQLAISGQGDIAGSVSGGCVEGAVVVEALDALADERQKLLEFGVSDEDAFAVGLACGGTINILLEPVGPVLPEIVLQKIVEGKSARQSFAYLVDTVSGARAVATAEQDPRVARCIENGMSWFEEDTFIALYQAPLRLVIVGAVRIAQYLVPLARQTGFEVTLVDPRPVFAEGERFTDIEVLDGWPDRVLSELGLEARSAVVTLTHDAKLDDPALRVALSSRAFYIGSLGSRRTHAKRIDRLQAEGFDAADLDRIHGPVGLSIGAKSPAEIAVSIMAEIVATLRMSSTQVAGEKCS